MIQGGRPGFNPWVGKTSGESNSNLLQCSCWRILRTEEPGRLQSPGSQSGTRLSGFDLPTHRSPEGAPGKKTLLYLPRLTLNRGNIESSWCRASGIFTLLPQSFVTQASQFTLRSLNGARVKRKCDVVHKMFEDKRPNTLSAGILDFTEDLWCPEVNHDSH